MRGDRRFLRHGRNLRRTHGGHAAAVRARPFKLICVTDRARQLDPSIEQIDCTAWQELRARGGRATRLKLGLFNPAYIPYTEFVYPTFTLVIRASLGPLLEFSRSQETDLVIVNGWFYDGYNSCVMRIRPAGLRFIYEDFVSGREYPAKIPRRSGLHHRLAARTSGSRPRPSRRSRS